MENHYIVGWSQDLPDADVSEYTDLFARIIMCL